MKKPKRNKIGKKLNSFLRTLLNYALFNHFEVILPCSFEIRATVKTDSWHFEQKISYVRQ